MLSFGVHLSNLTKPFGEFLFTGTEPGFALMAISLDGIKDVSQHREVNIGKV
jgi:hypothetical protein